MISIGDLIPNWHVIAPQRTPGIYGGSRISVKFGWYNENGIFGATTGIYDCKEYLTNELVKPETAFITVQTSNATNTIQGSRNLINQWEQRLKFNQQTEIITFPDTPDTVIIIPSPEWKKNLTVTSMFALLVRSGLGLPKDYTIPQWLNHKRFLDIRDYDHINHCKAWLLKAFKKGSFFVGCNTEMKYSHLVDFCRNHFNVQLAKREESKIKKRVSQSLSNLRPVREGPLEPFEGDDEAALREFAQQERLQEIHERRERLREQAEQLGSEEWTWPRGGEESRRIIRPRFTQRRRPSALDMQIVDRLARATAERNARRGLF